MAIVAWGKLLRSGVGCHLVAWIVNYLTDRPQYARLQNCVSYMVVYSRGSSRERCLLRFYLHCILWLQIQYNQLSPAEVFGWYCCGWMYIRRWRSRKPGVIIGRVIADYVNWCALNYFCIDASKTKEMLIDFRRKASKSTSVTIQVLAIERVTTLKYLGVHL